jgi:hypothetical protein
MVFAEAATMKLIKTMRTLAVAAYRQGNIVDRVTAIPAP